ncbi:MAG: DUF5666 domain-containing protein, partial [Halieaceae bacterium]|nr:DUF5666 domain-containing protein [Halieaceae bacterium]
MKPLFDPKSARRGLVLLTAGSILCLAGCGGGGGGGGLASVSDPVGGGAGGDTGGGVGGGAGIGGTGLSASGVITGTGSIFVNGTRFDVDNAEIFVNGAAAGEADLGLGMIVSVSGTQDGDGNAIADRVNYDSLIEGAIDSIERNADNSSARLRILGQIVLVERTSTVFEDSAFDTLAAGDRVEISGFVDVQGRIRATRVDGEDDAGDDVTVSGVITGLNGSRFFIGGQEIDASGANLDLDSATSLRDGLNVEVDGVLDGSVLVATEVDERDRLRDGLAIDDDASAEGPITGFNGVGDFLVDGLPVTAGNASISTGGLPLANDLIVEVDGSWNGSVLVADVVTARRGRIELAAPLADIEGTTLTLQFGSDTVSVTTNTRTLLDDDRDDIEFLSLSDLAIGDYLDIEAILEGNALVATRVDRDDDDDEVEIQAPVEAFVEGRSITVLGLTFDVTGAEFEDAGDNDVSASTFFRNLRIGSLIS